MGRNKITQEEFINKVTKMYPEYDFSKVIYKSSIEKVEVKCQHRTWYFRPSSLLYGNCGCKKCRGTYKKKCLPMSQEKFLERATKIFPNYDYSKSIYINANEKVEIGCEHGYWWIRANDLFHGHTGCKECKKIITQKTNIEKYGSVCSLHCQEVHEKVKDTMIERYGAEYSFNSPELQEKIRKTMIDKYGVEKPWMNPQFHEKQKNTMLERYGVEYATQSQEFLNKQKETNLIRYGVENPSSLLIFKEKRTNTTLERYGVKYCLQSQEFQEKLKTNLIKKYGVDNVFKISEVREKQKETMLERYGVDNCSRI